MRAVLSAPMVAGPRALGALKLYSLKAGAYDARAERLLSMIATEAAILLAHGRTAARSGLSTSVAPELLHADAKAWPPGRSPAIVEPCHPMWQAQLGRCAPSPGPSACTSCADSVRWRPNAIRLHGREQVRH
jgi:hypothetical protein